MPHRASVSIGVCPSVMGRTVSSPNSCVEVLDCIWRHRLSRGSEIKQVPVGRRNPIRLIPFEERRFVVGHWLVTSIIPATQEAESRRMAV
jgi:hypothetical protein